MAESLVFLAGKRTPFGSYGGSLKDINPTELCVQPGKAALEQSGVRPDQMIYVDIRECFTSAVDNDPYPQAFRIEAGCAEAGPGVRYQPTLWLGVSSGY